MQATVDYLPPCWAAPWSWLDLSTVRGREFCFFFLFYFIKKLQSQGPGPVSFMKRTGSIIIIVTIIIIIIIEYRDGIRERHFTKYIVRAILSSDSLRTIAHLKA